MARRQLEEYQDAIASGRNNRERESLNHVPNSTLAETGFLPGMSRFGKLGVPSGSSIKDLSALEEWTTTIREQERNYMNTNVVVTKTATFGGALLVVVGLLGFIAPGFMGMHLSALHNVMVLLSGVVAIYFGLMATQATGRTFCLVFGAMFGLLGLAGFAAGGTDYTFTIIPGALVLGTMDHLVHLILGAIFLLVGWVQKPATATTPAR